MQAVPLHPEQASTIARSVDQLHFFLTGVTLFFTALIFGTIFYFAVKFRRRSPDEIPPQIEGSLPLELVWTLIPAALTVFMFLWASSLYFRNSRPPIASTEMFVIGKQWMWHLQHPEGPREINELHVPLGVPVKLTMTSEDVIHDFYIPAFRVKKDVIPGLYTSIWFQATKLGTYHFFCAQYCGTQHAGMIGWVFVMTPADYAAWLRSQPKPESMAAMGERLFTEFNCAGCHGKGAAARGPSLAGVYGGAVRLQDGRAVTADDAFIRQAILQPASVPAAGYPPIMPAYVGQLTEEQVLQLIAYIKSLPPEGNKP